MGIKKLSKKLLKFAYKLIAPSYTHKQKSAKGMILVSYITEPFFKSNNKNYLNGHQNRRETLIIADILRKLNYSFKFVRLDKIVRIASKYDVIFGVEPNFINACISNPKAIKIYYATGAYCNHQDKMVVDRTDEFNKTHNASISYTRRPIIHNACEIADYIFQIGSKYTISTYPIHLQRRIRLIRQTCHEFKFDNFIERKLKQFNKSCFVWMGSGGSILKGLDIVLDYFIAHSNYELHVLGPIDDDVYAYYRQPLLSCNNIHIHGFVDLDSSLMEEIGLSSTFTIMLSGSEGCPGAVINMMKLGCIPIVSKYCAFEGLENVGTIVDSIDINSFDNAVKSAQLLSSEILTEQIKKSYHISNSTFNSANFYNDLRSAFDDVLN